MFRLCLGLQRLEQGVVQSAKLPVCLYNDGSGFFFRLRMVRTMLCACCACSATLIAGTRVRDPSLPLTVWLCDYLQHACRPLVVVGYVWHTSIKALSWLGSSCSAGEALLLSSGQTRQSSPPGAGAQHGGNARKASYQHKLPFTCQTIVWSRSRHLEQIWLMVSAKLLQDELSRSTCSVLVPS